MRTKALTSERQKRIGSLLAIAAVVFLAGGSSGNGLVSTSPASTAGTTLTQDGPSKKKKDEEEKPRELTPSEIFVPDFEDHDLDGTEERAWEYRPYKVAVWFCLDGSPVLDANYQSIAYGVTKRSELMDGSGWDLTTGPAPSRFRSRLLRYLATPEKCLTFDDVRCFEDYDKLMVVCLQTENARIVSRVREFDVQTQQWGPINRRVFASINDVSKGVANSIARSFMPLVRIDRLDEVIYETDDGTRARRDEVVMQVRAVKSCQHTVLVETALLPEEVRAKYRPKKAADKDADAEDASAEDSSDSELASEEEQIQSNVDDGRFTYIAETSLSSPAYVRNSDRFLPVIRKTDKKGELVSLDPVPFTYLTVRESNKTVVRADIHSSNRAPLSQRKSKRARKLALVIRPPTGSTTMRLTSRDKKTRMEGFEIYSRKPNQPISEKSEFIGKTDWRGEIEVPPAPEGLRLIYVKRGARALKKIPIIPGLYQAVETSLPNDETRLYAEGVFDGLENEVLGLVIRRNVAEQDVAAALKKGDATAAREALDELNEIESYSDLRRRLSDAAADLRFRADDGRERSYIESRTAVLEGIIGKYMAESKDKQLTSDVLTLFEQKGNSNQE